eukprot:939964-Alexandrium_andersonii.AAC.1
MGWKSGRAVEDDNAKNLQTVMDMDLRNSSSLPIEPILKRPSAADPPEDPAPKRQKTAEALMANDVKK